MKARKAWSLSQALPGSLQKVLCAAMPCAVVCLSLIAGTTSRGDPAADEGLRYAAFRIIRASAGEPSEPEITLPQGYTVVPGDRYQVASRAEYYAFVQGKENSEGVPVSVCWPGERIEAVVGSNQRLPLERGPGSCECCVSFGLPVVAGSPDEDQATIQVWSFMKTTPGINWRIEHNDPDRAAGPWVVGPWPEGQVRAVIHMLVASEAILRDAGLDKKAAAKGHFYALMGFETNNTLHPDNPPHWHLAYYAGPSFRSPAYLPHFWIDSEGRNFYNGMNVTGNPLQRFRAGDPAPMQDFNGNHVLTTTIREDGGLNIDAPNGPTYAIVPGTEDDFVKNLQVTRNDQPWLRIRTEDNVRKGELEIEIIDQSNPASSRTTVHEYDPLTGVLR